MLDASNAAILYDIHICAICFFVDVGVLFIEVVNFISDSAYSYSLLCEKRFKRNVHNIFYFFFFTY